MLNSLITKKGIKGKAERRLFDSKKLAYAKAVAQMGADSEYVEKLINLAAKPMFKENALWKLLNPTVNVGLLTNSCYLLSTSLRPSPIKKSPTDLQTLSVQIPNIEKFLPTIS